MLSNYFLSHPHSVNESYQEHCKFALYFAFFLILAGCAAVIHAFVPPLFETTASRIMGRLTALMEKRQSKNT